ncbi:hypothetical protein RI129_002825 [Pyrocoelia pectoralis]|uniref:Uncharacterized protein n=1 Tax=Pyrocoelia pectoralis TaxID=417401 RepID=A0AAN7ZU63_9COLE
MEGSKCIISIKTHDLVTFKGTNLPVLDGDTVLLYNRQANCVVRAPLTKSIRDIFKIAEKERHEETVVEDDYEAVEEEEDAIMQKEMGETIKQTEETITELLIVEYSNRPPLHNERLPIIERSRSIKKSLELEVYNALGGQMSLEDIPKKWCYLKKEYKKQKNIIEQICSEWV